MNKKLKVSLYVILTLFFFYTLSALHISTDIFTSSYTYDDFSFEIHDVDVIVNNEISTLTLPHNFYNLKKGDKITLSTTFDNPERNYLYFESSTTPVKIYNNHILIFEHGKKATYPSYFKTPVESCKLIRINNSEEEIQLSLEYTVIDNLDVLNIQPLLFGSQSGLFFNLFADYGFSFLFSIILIFLSLFLIIVTGLTLTFERRVLPFLWLSIASLSTGLWILAECPLTSINVHNPALLYIVSITSMSLFPLFLIMFALSVVKFKYDTNLKVISYWHFLDTTIGLFCLSRGFISPETLSRVFNVLTPITIGCFALCVTLEYLLHQNMQARRFSIPSIVFAGFTILEFINYKTHFIKWPISFLQIGILLFIIAMGILGGLFVKDSSITKNKNRELQMQMSFVDYQASVLKKQSNIMMHTSDEIHKFRHDLRHQLKVIKDLANNANKEELNHYLNTLIEDIPVTQHRYCDNMAINAIVTHYASVCKRQGIEFNTKLNIPRDSLVPDTDFCVIFGNLLENAIEACSYVTDEKKFIKISTHMQFNTLIISMENSFDGTYTTQSGKALSRKRADYGIGLSSIQSVAKKHHGDAQFKAENLVFCSSIYILI